MRFIYHVCSMLPRVHAENGRGVGSADSRERASHMSDPKALAGAQTTLSCREATGSGPPKPQCKCKEAHRVQVPIEYPKGPSTPIVGFQGPKTIQSMDCGT